jgi:hypothetical protein
MGNPLPPEIPDFVDEKYYCVEVAAYETVLDNGWKCGDYTRNYHGCIRGSVINTWLATGGPMNYTYPLIGAPIENCQLLMWWSGPYDTGGECEAVCPIGD